MPPPWRRNRKLSHQFSGEPDLLHRLAANTKTQLDQSGENVAFAPSVDQAQDNLMHSPPHRANLLNAQYNVAGFSVVRSGSLLYVTQDFGHSLPAVRREAEVLVAGSVDRMRAQSRRPATAAPGQQGSRSHSLCDGQSRFVADPGAPRPEQFCATQPPSLKVFHPKRRLRPSRNGSVQAWRSGSCYARSAAYPTGVYWIVLLFY